MSNHLTNEEKLDAIYEMTLENHEVLKSIRRQQFLANSLRVLYWLAILGALGGTYYYIKPLVATLSGNSLKVEETINQFNQLKDQLPETKVINHLMEGFQKTDQTATDTATDTAPQN